MKSCSSSSSQSLTYAEVASRMAAYLSNSEEDPNVRSAIPLLKQLEVLYDSNPCDIPQCKELLSQLKLLLVRFPSCSPQPQKLDATELFIARETQEYAALISVRNRDTKAFERHIAQLFTYYQDFSQFLPPSERQPALLGLHLLFLLAQNRIGEFHMALELIPEELWQTSKYIRHPVELEHHLMDGNYNRVFEAKNSIPSGVYGYFMEILVSTVRQKIAKCLEMSYAAVDVAFATRLLVLENKQELTSFIQKENARKKDEGEFDVEWRVENTEIRFVKVAPTKQEIPAIELLQNTVGYATELERIV